MQASAPPPSEAKSPDFALAQAYTAAMEISSILHVDDSSPRTNTQASRDAIQRWNAHFLESAHAPAELAKDCVSCLHSTVLSTTEETPARHRGATPPFGKNFRSSSSAASSTSSPAPFTAGAGAHRSPSGTRGSGGGNAADAAAPVSLSPSLDVDHCTIARLLKEEDQQWEMWQETHHVSPDSTTATGFAGAADVFATPATAVPDDVFSDAWRQREAWQCWASVLRDVKTEAVVKHEGRRNRRGTADHSVLEAVLDYLEVPETPWLLEDRLSSVLMATDMYMANRAYDLDGGGSSSVAENEFDDTGRDALDMFNGSGRMGRDTQDMKAVYAYALRQGEEKPPLRSLLSLALASHVDDGGNDTR